MIVIILYVVFLSPSSKQIKCYNNLKKFSYEDFLESVCGAPPTLQPPTIHW